MSVRRVGHKGADHIAPGNTPASFDAAVAAGVDMIEFDVLPENRDGTGALFLAHDYGALARGGAPTLDEGLAHLASAAFDGIELDVDMKLPGYERAVIDAVRAHGLTERTLISTMEPASLVAVRALAPEIRLGWSVPRVRRDYLANPVTRQGAKALILVGREILPARAARELRAGRIDAVMSHHALITPRLARAVSGAGGELYAWTVDDAPTIARLQRIGVTGVITNDPRLFAAASAPA